MCRTEFERAIDDALFEWSPAKSIDTIGAIREAVVAVFSVSFDESIDNQWEIPNFTLSSNIIIKKKSEQIVCFFIMTAESTKFLKFTSLLILRM